MRFADGSLNRSCSINDSEIKRQEMYRPASRGRAFCCSYVSVRYVPHITDDRIAPNLATLKHALQKSPTHHRSTGTCRCHRPSPWRFNLSRQMSYLVSRS